METFTAWSSWMQELRRLCGLGKDDQGLNWRGESFYLESSSTSTDKPFATLYVWIDSSGGDVTINGLQQLLWLQLQVVGLNSPVFGCEPESGDLVIAQAIEWRELSPAQALPLMNFLADLAAQSRAILSGSIGSAQKAAQRPAAQRVLPRWWMPPAQTMKV